MASEEICPNRLGCRQAISFSVREMEFLELLAQGKGRAQIAAACCVNPKTVDAWAIEVRGKLVDAGIDCASIYELRTWAVKQVFKDC